MGNYDINIAFAKTKLLFQRLGFKKKHKNKPSNKPDKSGLLLTEGQQE